MLSFKELKRRGKEKILQKVGQSSPEKGDEFNNLVSDFDKKERALTSFVACAQEYQNKLLAVQAAESQLGLMAQELINLQADKTPEQQAALLSAQQVSAITARHKDELRQVHKTWQAEIMGPLRDMRIFAFKVRQLIKERKTDKIDFEAYRHKVGKSSSLGGSGSEKEIEKKKTQDKYEAVKARFSENDMFLKTELGRLNDNWSSVISSELDVMLVRQGRYHQYMHELFVKHRPATILSRPLQSGEPERRHDWLLNGSTRVKVLVGYNDLGQIKRKPQRKSSKGTTRSSTSTSASIGVHTYSSSRTKSKSNSKSKKKSTPPPMPPRKKTDSGKFSNNDVEILKNMRPPSAKQIGRKEKLVSDDIVGEILLHALEHEDLQRAEALLNNQYAEIELVKMAENPRQLWDVLRRHGIEQKDGLEIDSGNEEQEQEQDQEEEEQQQQPLKRSICFGSDSDNESEQHYQDVNNRSESFASDCGNEGEEDEEPKRSSGFESDSDNSEDDEPKFADGLGSDGENEWDHNNNDDDDDDGDEEEEQKQQHQKQEQQ